MSKHFTIIFSVISLVVSIIALVFSFADIRIEELQFKPDHFLAVIGAIMSSIGFIIGIYFALLAVKAYGDIKEIEKQAETIKNIRIEVEGFKTDVVNVKTEVETYKNTIETDSRNIKVQVEKIENDCRKTENLSEGSEKINTSINEKFTKITDLAKKAEDVNNSIHSILNSHTNQYIETIDSQINLNDILKSSLNENDPNYAKLSNRFSSRREDLTRLRARMCYEFPYLDETQRNGFFAELGGLGNENDLPHLEKILKSENEADYTKELVGEIINNIKERLELEAKKK